jgi:hypothetical protein
MDADRYTGETCRVCGPDPAAPCTAAHCYRTKEEPMRHSHLERVNEPGTVGVWQCKCGARGTLAELRAVQCSAEFATDEDLIAAIEGPKPEAPRTGTEGDDA